MNSFTHLNRKMHYGIRSVIERIKYTTRPQPTLNEEQRRAIHDLRTEGVHVTSIEQLFGTSPCAAAYAEAASFINTPSHRDDTSLWRNGISSRDITPAALLAHLPGLYLAGLDAGLLSLVGGYLGKAVAYHGCVIRTSAVDGRAAGTRIWHQDAEDLNVLRMVVYLNDVAPGGGPFEYIPRSTGLSYRDFRTGDLTNERMNEVMPSSRWKQVYGPAGTVVLCDTARVFHHESIQEKRARSVVMIGYSSRFPKSMGLAMNHFPVEQVRGALNALLPADREGEILDWRNPKVAHREQRQRVIADSKSSLRPA